MEFQGILVGDVAMARASPTYLPRTYVRNLHVHLGYSVWRRRRRRAANHSPSSDHTSKKKSCLSHAYWVGSVKCVFEPKRPTSSHHILIHTLEAHFRCKGGVSHVSIHALFLCSLICQANFGFQVLLLLPPCCPCKAVMFGPRKSLEATY